MDNFNKFGIAAGLGGLGAGLGQMMFGGNNNPADSAMPYLNQVKGTISPYYNPYINAGQGALGQLQGQYGNLMNDPTAMMNKIGSQYQQSPGYQWQVNQTQNAADNAAAAGGMLGSPQHQYQSANMVGQLANQDYYNYLNHGLGLYGQGLEGMGNINQMGYGASNELANSLGNMLMSQGQLSYEGQAGQNKSDGSMWGDLMGGAATLLPFLL